MREAYTLTTQSCLCGLKMLKFSTMFSTEQVYRRCQFSHVLLWKHPLVAESECCGFDLVGRELGVGNEGRDSKRTARRPSAFAFDIDTKLLASAAHEQPQNCCCCCCSGAVLKRFVNSSTWQQWTPQCESPLRLRSVSDCSGGSVQRTGYTRSTAVHGTLL
jgi:hypothetical protein